MMLHTLVVYITPTRKQVDEAFNTLQTWQALATGLPLLVDRLRALEALHLASASFAQRLEKVTCFFILVLGPVFLFQHPCFFFFFPFPLPAFAMVHF